MSVRGRTALLLVLCGCAIGVTGCGHNIGDGCTANVDCSPVGDRFCDTAEPGGYCSVEGCDNGTCPDNSVCVRFFTPVANEPCMFGLPTSGCRIDERCLCDRSLADGSCPASAPAHCAPESSERRWCQAPCSSNGDCRPGYECRQTGTLGAEPVPIGDDAGVITAAPVKFCAPIG